MRILKESEIDVLGPEDLREYAKELARYAKELEELAYKDPLTGLNNRRALENELKSLERGNYALLFIDVDNFKKINDTYGHKAGDHVLKRIARALKGSTRISRGQDKLFTEAFTGRYGGDEMIVLLKDIKPENIPYVMERITEYVEREKDNLKKTLKRLWRMKKYPHSEEVLRDIENISLSMGVGVFEEYTPEVLKTADKALYQTKRHRVEQKYQSDTFNPLK
ncbi:MAG: hypothetical protein DRP54_04685 [Spirochaetes bacterium]|nr:MAG: hypothetical protein DRP54_04685 [Spirochaetota bacterium]